MVPIDANLAETRAANYRRAFDRLATHCKASTNCNDMGDVAENVDELAASLAQKPVLITAERPFEAGPVDVLVDGDRLHLLVLSALYSQISIQQLPNALAEALAGEPDALRPLVEMALFALDPVSNSSEGFGLSVLCREEWPFTDAEKASADSNTGPSILADGFDFERDCAIWDTPAAPQFENEPVVSDIPTIVFAGAFDPVTPPSDGASRRPADQRGLHRGPWRRPRSRSNHDLYAHDH